MSYLLGRSVEASARKTSKARLGGLIERYGPVVRAYPHWHPLVSGNDDNSKPVTTPSEQCGYKSLDHTIFLKDAFITCPYGAADEVIASVERVAQSDVLADIAVISAEQIDTQLYHPNATPVLVKCEWERGLNDDGTIPAWLAVPLLLERELPCWRTAQVGETWETMAPYILGRPHGSRSSLFVNEKTGQTLKSIWNALINTGMYGPISVGR